MEDPKTNVPEQEALDEWQQILTPTPQSSSSSVLSPPKQLEQSILRENYLQEIKLNPSSSIFPPSQHERLDSEAPCSSPVLSASSSPSDDDDGLKKLQPSSRRGVLEMLKYGVFGVVLRIRNFYAAAAPGGRFFWAFGSVVGVAVVVAAFRLYVNAKLWLQGRRQKAEEEWRKGLLQMAMEKDQKINKLLLQISQMNELISARQKVPVLRLE